MERFKRAGWHEEADCSHLGAGRPMSNGFVLLVLSWKREEIRELAALTQFLPALGRRF